MEEAFIVSFIKALQAGEQENCLERMKSFYASISYDLENNQEKHYQTSSTCFPA